MSDSELLPVTAAEIEAVARVLDPEAWLRREQFQAIIAGTADHMPDTPEKLAMYLRSATRRVDSIVEPSLALARACIEAMPTRHRHEAQSELVEALEAIRDLTRKQQLPITAQVNDLATAALAKIGAKP